MSIRGGLTRWSAVLNAAMFVLPAADATRSRASALREFDRAVGQQIKHERAAAGDRGHVRAAGTVDDPSCAMAVERRTGVERHDEVDLAGLMTMVTAGDVVHVDDVDREAVRRRAGLDDASVLDAGVFAIAHPSAGDRIAARGENRSIRVAFGREAPVQRLLQRRV